MKIHLPFCRAQISPGPTTPILLAWAITVTLACCTASSPVAAENFRVLPYLQQPSSSGMLFTWFTQVNAAGTLQITGPHLFTPLRFTSEPQVAPGLRYTEAELNQNVNGLAPGSWLYHDGDTFKHEIEVRGLQAATIYTYTVTQGKSTFSRNFTTAPTAESWTHLRFIAMSDSETQPAGRVTHREWPPGEIAPGSRRPAVNESRWAVKFGTKGMGSNTVLRYPLSKTEGYRRNLAIVDSRNPAFVVMPGDLVQGGGFQPAWDEFWRHSAGEYGEVMTRRPILPALGNWENFGALNGGYGSFNDPIFGDKQFGPKFGREKYKTYFAMPENGTDEHRGNYYRSDYGPITILTLDSSNGEPDDHPQNYGGTGQPPKIKEQHQGVGTDTQSNFSREQYQAFGGKDLADFNPGSVQWHWAVRQLQDARAKGQVIFAQWHHAPFSDGVHGQPMDHRLTSGQGGTPMRQYHPLLEQYGVVAVFSGHSEMFERSFVDVDGNGVGVHYFDVGIAGDGLLGEKRTSAGFADNRLQYNPFSRWSADEHEAEVWAVVDGVDQLVAGGRHYGHLEVNLTRLGDGMLLEMLPVHSFPLLDHDYNLLGTERRVYGDILRLRLGENGIPLYPFSLRQPFWSAKTGF